ncbi:AAA family ATPase [Streptomyces viridosporus]|uniref:Nuclease SbcCD subunit C n=1 Tax=Streptomyces viridosporus T7A TaxID=665577 RepID=A0ABX6A8J2_STRVD|nr:SMC family ATPase [Streptomyces viridosporus]QEU83790.1 SMC family ATPase [Streptomyces viridosporus T7A]
MRPVLLEMDGFASFREPAAVDFREVDYFALVGPTGSGKSTVIDAITFALYGSVPRWNNRRTVANALAPTTDRGTVRLVFDLAEHRYVAARELRRAAAGGVGVKNARLERLADPDALGTPDDITEVLASDSEVTPAVEKLLGLPFEHFITCVVLPQGDFAEFLHAQPARRQEILVKLMGLEIYPRIAQAANTEAERARQRAELLAQQLEEFTDATEYAEQAAQGRVATLEEVAERVRAALPELAEHGAAVTEARRACETLTAERDRLRAVAVSAGPEELGKRERDIKAAEEAADEELAAAEAADTAAREQLAAAPPRAPLEQARRDHMELDTLERRLPATQALQRHCARALSDVTAAEEEAEGLALQARRTQEATARSHLAAALRTHLRDGAACPVCGQRVTTTPGPPAAPDLDRAEQARVRADREVERLREAWTEAFRAEQRATGELNALTGRIVALRSVLADALPREQTTAALALRERWEGAADAADARLRRARAARASAEQATTRVRREVQAAWSALEHVRDPLVTLGAPVPDRDDLAAAWTALVSWAAAAATTREAALSGAYERLARVRGELTTAEGRLVGVLATHEVALHAGRPLTETAEPAVAAALEGARQEARRLIERRKQAAKLDMQRQHKERAHQVARTLGHLLRADGFPRWLVATTLDTLVAEASGTLAELSGGQFELTHDDGGFLVVDHADADSRRPVRTLSGGESFQASLALALALSAQLPAMAAAGAAQLESIFLDEGFGALDEATLETVAATLEELATRRDQVVGIVTHIDALAERVPVRFAVRRGQGTSSIQREAP